MMPAVRHAVIKWINYLHGWIRDLRDEITPETIIFSLIGTAIFVFVVLCEVK